MINLTDGREEIPLDLTDEELLKLFKLAHEADLTFNQFIEKALTEFLERHTDDQIRNKLDGSNNHAVVQRPWPYPS
jgi:hypothetical protein